MADRKLTRREESVSGPHSVDRNSCCAVWHRAITRQLQGGFCFRRELQKKRRAGSVNERDASYEVLWGYFASRSCPLPTFLLRILPTTTRHLHPTPLAPFLREPLLTLIAAWQRRKIKKENGRPARAYKRGRHVVSVYEQRQNSPLNLLRNSFLPVLLLRIP